MIDQYNTSVRSIEPPKTTTTHSFQSPVEAGKQVAHTILCAAATIASAIFEAHFFRPYYTRSFDFSHLKNVVQLSFDYFGVLVGYHILF